MHDPAVIVIGFILIGGLGLLVGSFLNVVIARVPAGESIVRPRSSCPKCHHEIRHRDNIPVISYVILRGRCRDCGTSISWRYPLVEVCNAVLWLVMASWALTQNSLQLLPLLIVLSSAGLALFCIDLDTHRLPNAIVLWLYPVTLIGLGLAGVLSGEWPIVPALVGAGIWLLVFGGIWLISGGRALGFGDVKLAPVLGVTLGWIGWGPAIVGLLAVWVLGGVFAVALLVTGRAKRGTALALGPFMIIGFVLGVLAGGPAFSWYLGTNGLS